MGRKTILSGVCCALIATALSGAEVFGTVSENSKPVAPGTALKLECGGASASAVTDQFGSYSLRTAAAGDCKLTLNYKGSSPSLKLTLYEKPSRYDLVLKNEAGKITLSRK